MSFDRRAACTPSDTSNWLVRVSERIWMTASTTAISSGTAISARPSSMRPVRDFGRAHFIVCSNARIPGWLPGFPLQSLFPIQRGAHDGVDVVEFRLPAEDVTHLVRLGDQRRRITRTARFLAHREFDTGDFLDARDHFADAVAVTVAAVRDQRFTSVAQVGQGVDVCGGEVFDMDVVAYPGAI